MFRMSHLGPHTFVAQDHHHREHEWLSHFSRDERHRLVQEDYDARTSLSRSPLPRILAHVSQGRSIRTVLVRL